MLEILKLEEPDNIHVFNQPLEIIFQAYLYNRMSSCGGFDRTPASLCLVVSSVVRLGLHLNVEFILVCATGNRPFQWRKRSNRDAVEHEGYT